MRKLRIGTRGSKLALWQAHFTQAELKKIGYDSELVVIKTKGDLIQHLSFDKIEGKGFFTKEIEDALLRGEVDMAVHSMKDMSTSQPDGLALTAVSYRANPADWLIAKKTSIDENETLRLRLGAVVGTSSVRRKAQLLDFRPDLVTRDIRGNVPTRIDKLREGDFDAIFLAAAGVERLEIDISEFAVIELHPREFVPAPAQGVLTWQTHAHDLETRRILKRLHHTEVSACTNVERKVLQMYAGGCQLPLGVYCFKDDNGFYHATAAIYSEGSMKRVSQSSSTTYQLAERLFAAISQQSVNS